jgi:Protein ChrB, N-terminal
VRAEALIDALKATRAQEYIELAGEAEGFLAHIRRETEHREFTFADVEEFEGDLAKLKRWTEQVRTRDHFASHEAERVRALLAHCEEELATFLDAAAREDEART